MRTATLEKLAFHRVLDALAERCQTFAGQAQARSLTPSLSLADMAHAHERLAEAIDEDISLGGVSDVQPLIARVRDGGLLDGSECLAIAYTMDAAATVKRAVALSGRPHLTELVAGMASFDAVLRLVREQLDPQGEVRDDATPKLRDIRRRLQPMRGRIRDRLAQLLAQYAEHVQDPIITLRRDRYVIPVKAAAQSRVPGLILDTSDSGATVFIEPAAVVPMNNELALLEFEERDEVRRILLALAQRLAFDPGLEPTLELLTKLDVVTASARLARDWMLVRPHVGLNESVQLPAARHPLIENCVANDIVLHAKAPLLVLTGPNAGGKTVLLKTLGLAVCMAHAGLFVAAAARMQAADGRQQAVTLPHFDALWADIGDEQSIEASLSTYAAHLTNLRHIVDAASPRTLLLIDELGSGTDPEEGAALSQAILESLVARGAFGVITTHLAPLKVFAAHSGGVVNAAMRFDVDALRPTFELVLGAPGRSYALAIAERIGLGPELLARAEAILGPEGARLERLLATLETQRQALEQELTEARAASTHASSEAAILREQIERLRAQEAALLEKAGERADAMLRDTLERARALRQTAREDPSQRGRAMEAIRALRAEVKGESVRATRANNPSKLRPGAWVRVPSYGAEGPVVAVRGDMLVVQLGLLKVEVPQRDVVRVATADRAADAPAPSARSRQTPSAPAIGSSHMQRELNVRGERVEPALEQVRDFVAQASAVALESVRILHGKGSGALRDAIRRELKADRRVEGFEDAPVNEGGFGVTVVRLRTR